MGLKNFLSGILGNASASKKSRSTGGFTDRHDPEEVMQICRDAGGDWETQAAACLIATTLFDDADTRSEAHYFRGNALEELGRFQEAIEEFDRAIELVPAGVDAMVNRGLTYRRMGEPERARQDYDRAIEIDPDSRPARMNRAFLSIQTEDYTAALEDLNRLLSLDPTDVFALINRSGAHKGLGDTAAALRDLDKAIEHQPEFADFRIQRAQLYEELDQHESAREDLIAAVSCSPDDPSARADLADLLALGDESVRDLDAALGHQRIVVNMVPEDIQQRHQLASIATLAGDVEQAVAAWEYLIAQTGIADKFQAELRDKGYLNDINVTGEWDEASRIALTAYVSDGRIPFDE